MPQTKDLGSNKFVLRVQPNLTKPEIKSYVSQLYDVPIKKVNTMNYEGKLKRNPRRGKYYSTKRYKKAIITLHQEGGAVRLSDNFPPRESIEGEVLSEKRE